MAVNQIDNLQNHEFVLKSDPAFIEISSNAHGLFKRFFVKDSLLDYYPYMEFVINDESSFFIEDNLFTEGLKFDFEWRYLEEENENATLIHNFYWSEFQLPQTTNTDIATGDVIYPFLSHFHFQDAVKSKSWNANISTIVNEIMSSYTFPGTKRISEMIKITPTNNSDLWYQANKTDGYFINNILTTYAYNSSYKHSPFFSYLNLRGEFHFETVDKLFQQTPKEKFKFGEIDKSFSTGYLRSQNNNSILNFKIIHLGSPVNMENWHKMFYSINNNGIFRKEDFTLRQKLNKPSQNKFNIRKNYLTNIRDYNNFGLIDSTEQENHYKGWINREFLNSTSFPFRLHIFTNFRPDICCGDLIETEITSSIEEKDFIATELSGRWIVIESTHGMDQRGNAGSAFIIGKNSLDIYSEHRFYSDFF